jgi:hypothetical protein
MLTEKQIKVILKSQKNINVILSYAQPGFLRFVFSGRNHTVYPSTRRKKETGGMIDPECCNTRK